MAFSERLRWWATFAAKNWAILITIPPLLGISIYSTNDSMGKDAVIEATQAQVAEVAKQYAKEFNPSIVVHQKGKNWGKYIEIKLKEHEEELH